MTLNVREQIERIDQMLARNDPDRAQIEHADRAHASLAMKDTPLWLIAITGMVCGAAIFAAGMYVGAAIVW